MDGGTWEHICKKNLNIRFYPVSNNKKEQEQLSHICVLEENPALVEPEVYTVYEVGLLYEKNIEL